MSGNFWYDPNEKPPAQAKKILCILKGDIYVAQRFGEFFLPIPFCDSKFAEVNYKKPDMWQEIDFPQPLTGFMRFQVEGVYLTLDELEEKYPENYKEIVKMYVSTIKKKKR